MSQRARLAAGGVLVVMLAIAAASCGQTVSGAVDDASITARVKTALLNDTQISATKIDVSTANGIVTISGVVRSKDEETRAVQVARGVTGVREVRSTLNVSG